MMVRACCHPGDVDSSAPDKNVWDVVVIGAGPAGALISRQLAKLGSSVLLVDKNRFPRSKVCGGCLSSAALDILERADLRDLTSITEAVPLRTLHLASDRRAADIDLTGARSVSRELFDSELVAEAISAGVSFMAGAFAHLHPRLSNSRLISLSRNGRVVSEIRARVVVDASGLGSSLLKHEPQLQSIVDRKGRIGAGTILPVAPRGYEPGIVYMAVGRRGYVGIVRLADGRIDVAAALDVKYARDCGSIGHAAAAIVRSSGSTVFPMADRWRGTPPLTRRLERVAANGVFAVGDAARYVEPFTGEGIGWALASAFYAAPLVHAAAHGDYQSQELRWNLLYHNLLELRFRRCSLIANVLRRPILRETGIATLAMVPQIARPFLRQLHAPLSA